MSLGATGCKIRPALMPGERRGQRITLGTDIIRELWHERRPCNWVQIRVGSGRPGRRQKLTSSGKAFLSISHEQFTWEFSRVQKSMSGRCGAITLTGMTSFARTSGRSRRLQLRQTPQDIEGARALRSHLRGLDEGAGSLQARSNPAHPGTTHLGSALGIAYHRGAEWTASKGQRERAEHA